MEVGIVVEIDRPGERARRERAVLGVDGLSRIGDHVSGAEKSTVRRCEDRRCRRISNLDRQVIGQRGADAVRDRNPSDVLALRLIGVCRIRLRRGSAIAEGHE